MTDPSNASISTTSTEVLEHEAATLAGQIAAATCRFLLVVGELDERRAWAQWSCKSMAHWLSWRCSLAEQTARDQVRVARRMRELPVITAAFGRGELSYSKVRALVRVATPESDGDLAELARTATAAQLERIIRATAVAMTDPAQREELRGLWSGTDAEGMGEVRARVRVDELAIVDTAIAQALPGDGVSAETPVAPRRAEALVRICESYLAYGDHSRRGSDRNNVVIHVEADESGVTTAQTDAGTPVHAETARRLCCDARVEGMLGVLGIPVSTGRANRTPNRKQRRAVRKRDGGRCRWVGCTESVYVEAHHVRQWTDGGPTDLDNLVSLCWHHHHLVHEGGWSITFEANVLGCYRPDGTELVDPAPVTVLPPLDIVVDDERIVPRWDGDHLDLAACVDATLSMLRR